MRCINKLLFGNAYLSLLVAIVAASVATGERRRRGRSNSNGYCEEQFTIPGL